MTAAQIRAVIGDPAEIRPYGKPEARAEIWIYDRQVAHNVDYVASEVDQVEGYAGTGTGNNMGTVPQINYHTQNDDVHQVTVLLIVDGKLVAGRQQDVTHVSYDQ